VSTNDRRTDLRRRLARVAAAVAVSASAAAQPVWLERASQAPPDIDIHFVLAFDSARQRCVRFGQTDSPTTGIGPNATAEWDGTRWMTLSPASSPPGRTYTAMTYDAARGRVVLFGGLTNPGGAFLGDTWTWDGTNWTQEFPPNSPPPLSGHAMVYDSALQRVLLVGGQDAFGNLLSDIWEWDGTDWYGRSFGERPPGRAFHDVAYDRDRDRVVLFGGMILCPPGYGCSSNDTWEWDGSRWTHLTPLHSPPTRIQHALVYDGALRATVLFGGLDLGRTGVLWGDIWRWDGVDWTPLAAQSVDPPTRPHPRLVENAAGEELILVTHPWLSETGSWDQMTWTLGPRPAPARVAPSDGTESGGDRVTIEGQNMTAGAAPTVRFGDRAATVLSAASDRLVVSTPPGSGQVDVTVETAYGFTTLRLAYSYVPPDIAVRLGNVGARVGERESPLLVNGSGGDATRVLGLSTGEPIFVFLSTPSTRESARFAMYAWPGRPDGSTIAVLPRQLGETIFPVPLVGGAPQPSTIWNTIGRFGRLGSPTAPAMPAPTLLARVRHGSPSPVVFSMQGLIEDDGSLSPDGFSVTNAVVVIVQ
jgi:IPT/TIG domain-containing protein/galactose oxidase-like protein